jgi:phosphoribosylglycinamide formyltransferase 1
MGKKVVSFLVSARGLMYSAVMREIKNGHINARPGVVVTDAASSQVLERAKEFGMKSFYLDPNGYESKDEYERRILSLLDKHKTDLVVTAGYLRILSPFFVNRYRNRIINIHPSLLPSFPGRHSQKKALDYGVKITGCTAHFIDEGIDTGPIIMQSPVPVLEHDTLSSLSARILKEEFSVLSEAVNYFCEGKLEVVSHRVIVKNR